MILYRQIKEREGLKMKTVGIGVIQETMEEGGYIAYNALESNFRLLASETREEIGAIRFNTFLALLSAGKIKKITQNFSHEFYGRA